MVPEPEDTVTSIETGPDPRHLARRHHLVMLHSPDATRPSESALRLSSALVLGRPSGDESVTSIRDPEISRRHCVVRYDRQRVEIEDLGSKNGTWVNGSRVARALLQPNDFLRIGNTLLALELIPSPTSPTGGKPFVGQSAVFRDMLEVLARVAGHPVAVHLFGETGTGKELSARTLHDLSGRSGDFVPVNCGAIPPELAEATLFGHERGAFTGAQQASEGLFRQAHGGTLFLDEIGELPLALQAKLLRVLDSGEVRAVGATRLRRVEVRVVSATHKDLRKEVAAGRFRKDLFARISTYEARLPALRERRVDLPMLIQHFAATLGQRRPPKWTAGFLEAALLHDWPMNLRELRSTVHHLVLDAPGPIWQASDLHLAPLSGSSPSLETPPRTAPLQASPEPSTSLDGPQRLRRERGRPVRPDRAQVLADLETVEFTLSRLSKAYGVSRPTLYRWLNELDIDLER